MQQALIVFMDGFIFFIESVISATVLYYSMKYVRKLIANRFKETAKYRSVAVVSVILMFLAGGQIRNIGLMIVVATIFSALAEYGGPAIVSYLQEMKYGGYIRKYWLNLAIPFAVECIGIIVIALLWGWIWF